MKVWEVCVIGGGPSGSAAALKLAALGHRVCLVEREVFPRPHVGESLPPSILPLLATMGVRARMEDAGFLRPARAVVCWRDGVVREKAEASEPGFQVDRGRFDEIMLDEARQAGVHVIQPALALRPVRLSSGWRIPLIEPGGASAIEATWLVDARGRCHTRGGRKRRLSPVTIAVYAYWWPTSSGPETRVEAGPDEWFWGSPLPDGSFNACVFLDPSRWIREGRGDLRSFYFASLQRSQLLRPCLDGARPADVRACDASTYIDEDLAGDGFIKIGEAAAAIDPLSSQGVQVAMTSGWQAAIVLHTILDRPNRATLALEFYRDRLCEVVDRHSQLSGPYYSATLQSSEGPFWRRRSAGVEDPAPRWRASGVLVSPETSLRVSKHVRWIDTSCLRGDLVTSARAVTGPALDRPLVFLDDVEVAPLLYPLRGATTARDLVRGWSVHFGYDRAATLLRGLCHAGVLVPDSSCRLAP